MPITYPGLFSSQAFTRAWAEGMPAERVVHIPTQQSVGESFYGVARRKFPGLWVTSLGPAGLYAAPNCAEADLPKVVAGILSHLRRVNQLKFTWTVRFDQPALARALIATGLLPQKTATHVIFLRGKSYEEIFGGFTKTIRYQVRKARQSDLVVREAVTPQDVADYYAVHQKLVTLKDRANPYLLELFLALCKLKQNVRLLMVERQQRIIAGGVFLLDGESVLYWHGAADREADSAYPTSLLIDEAIRWAISCGCTSFNLGASGGIKNLADFKSYWGAEMVENWKFQWVNPLWKPALKLLGRGE